MVTTRNSTQTDPNDPQGSSSATIDNGSNGANGAAQDPNDNSTPGLTDQSSTSPSDGSPPGDGPSGPTVVNGSGRPNPADADPQRADIDDAPGPVFGPEEDNELLRMESDTQSILLTVARLEAINEKKKAQQEARLRLKIAQDVSEAFHRCPIDPSQIESNPRGFQGAYDLSGMYRGVFPGPGDRPMPQPSGPAPSAT